MLQAKNEEQLQARINSEKASKQAEEETTIFESIDEQDDIRLLEQTETQ